MSALAFVPHNDDDALFCFYQLLRHRPKVIVVLRSFRQQLEQGGPTFELREQETARAMEVAGCEWEQWHFPDNAQPWSEIKERIRQEIERCGPKMVIAPAYEMGGHEDHNVVSMLVQLWMAGAPDRLTSYLTYRRGHGRSTDGIEIIPNKEEQAYKEDALACYESQAAHPPTAAWFDQSRYGTLSEWVAD